MIIKKTFQGIVDSKVFEEFAEKKGTSIFSHAANCCSIDDFLSVAYVLCPDIVEVKGYIFISDLIFDIGPEGIKKVEWLEQYYNHNKILIEQWVNSRSIIDYFMGMYNTSMENEKVQEQFGKVLQYNWSKRAKELFPDRNIVVEVGEEIMGEEGLTITMYEQL